VGDSAYWRCDVCQATFLDPAQRLDAEAELAHYRLHRNDPDDPAYRGFLDRLAAPLLERLEAPSSGLDFGCGPGPALAAMLREAGHDVELYDVFFAPDPAVLLRRYDFVTCTETIEHFHDPAAEFRRLDTLLRPGGWLGLMTGMLSDGIDFRAWHYRRDPTHVVFYRRATLRYLASLRG
jgi:SAM-dependent methyltransferase